MTINLKDYTEILEPVFDKVGDGIAICHKGQGYGANGWKDKAIMLKSLDAGKKGDLIKALRQVTVTLSFEDFLIKFFNLWSEDATILAKILGFEVEGEGETYYTNYIESQVEAVSLMRSAKTEEDFLKLSFEEQEKITSLQKRFEKGLLSGDFISEGVAKGGSSSDSDNTNSDDKNLLKGNGMSDKNDTNVEDLVKSVQALEAELKVQKEKNDKLEKANLEQEEKVNLEKAKTLDFLEDGEAETLVGLFKSSGASGAFLEMFKILEKANDSIKKLTKTLEENDLMEKALSKSSDDEPDLDPVRNKVRDLLKSNKEKGEGK